MQKKRYKIELKKTVIENKSISVKIVIFVLLKKEKQMRKLDEKKYLMTG